MDNSDGKMDGVDKEKLVALEICAQGTIFQINNEFLLLYHNTNATSVVTFPSEFTVYAKQIDVS